MFALRRDVNNGKGEYCMYPSSDYVPEHVMLANKEV
jgi:hypothetical protein